MNVIALRAPYLIFTGSETRRAYTKTGAGIVQWRRELCAGHLQTGDAGIDLGLPAMTIPQATANGVGSLIIGTAAIGGGIAEDWLDILEQALRAGIDVVGGLHTPLSRQARLVAAAAASGARLVDVRIPPAHLPVGTGKRRNGKRVLMVGTDCAVGKKYSALALERDMRAAGLKADFRATGQTGIMIAGRGIPIDAVVSDFIAGAAEVLSPDNATDHWDVIEGQGGIFHPGYAAVTLGLLLGSQPDAFVVCHEAGRTHISGWEHFPLPDIEAVIERTVMLGALTNPSIHCVGVCVNTSTLQDGAREDYLATLSARLRLPCVDPIIDGTASIIQRLV